jgi:hypothetical protein
MGMEAALLARLTGDSATVALAGDRMGWDLRVQGDTIPKDKAAIVLQLVSATPEYIMTGREGLEASRVRVNCIAGSRLATIAAAEAAISAVEAAATSNGVRFQGAFVENKRDDVDPLAPEKLFRRSVELIVWHNPAA